MIFILLYILRKLGVKYCVLFVDIVCLIMYFISLHIEHFL
jgi:hypothetical protein